jgi:S1-C subfamily serine protease
MKAGTTTATISGANVVLGGDIITEVDGKKISGMDEVVNAVDAASPGDKLKVTVVRGDSTKDLTVTLGDRPASVQGAQSGSEGSPGR